jgi:hypothetical protein
VRRTSLPESPVRPMESAGLRRRPPAQAWRRLPSKPLSRPGCASPFLALPHLRSEGYDPHIARTCGTRSRSTPRPTSTIVASMSLRSRHLDSRANPSNNFRAAPIDASPRRRCSDVTEIPLQSNSKRSTKGPAASNKAPITIRITPRCIDDNFPSLNPERIRTPVGR